MESPIPQETEISKFEAERGGFGGRRQSERAINGRTEVREGKRSED
jgi:hypothetical protein